MTLFGVGGEDLFDGGFEEAGDFEGEAEAGFVAFGFDGVDGLARDLEFGGEVGLGPIFYGAQFAQAIFHL